MREIQNKLDNLDILIEDCQADSVTILSNRGIVKIRLGNTELLKILLTERSTTVTQLAFLIRKNKNKLLKELQREEQLRLI